MLRLTLKNLWARKLRLVTTSFAIAIGVAFITGSQILGATINKTFDDLFSNIYQNTDAVVRGEKVVSISGGDDIRAQIDESLIHTIRNVPGVADVAPSYNGTAQVVKDNKVVGTDGAPSFGDAWSNDPKLNAFQLVEGRAPTNDNQVVIDKGTAKKGKIEVGDTVTVLSQREPAPFQISGIAKFGQVDSPAGSSNLLFTNATAQRLVGKPGTVDTFRVAGSGTVDQGALVNKIAESMPKNVEVVTGKQATKEAQNSLKESLRFVSIFLSIFGGITLFVGAFIINNTFSILLAQRLKETALLRAIGASRRQVMRSMMLEALALGLVASGVGIALGIALAAGIKAVLSLIGVDIAAGPLTITTSAVVAALIAGTVITLVAAVLPARRSSKTPPIAALRDVARDDSARSVRRLITGIAVTAIGAAFIAIGLLADIDRAYVPVGGGAALVFIGVYIMGPAIARPASWVIGWPLPKVYGTTGHLARENAMRNPRRTSATAAALMVGVAVVTLASVVFTSVKESTSQAIDRSFTGDFFVTGGGNGFSPDLVARLKQSPDLGAVSEDVFIPTNLNGSTTYVNALDTKAIGKILDMNEIQGRIADLGTDQFGVTKKVATDKRWALGQEVTVKFTNGNEQKLKLGVIYDDPTGFLNYILPTETQARAGDTTRPSQVFVNRANGVSAATAKAAVEDITKAYAGVKVQDQTEFKKSINDQIDGILNIFYALLGLAIVIAVIGIINTLTLSVLERTREIGLMRAVGMTRRQVRRMVRWESVIVALLGTMLGLIVGCIFGTVLVRSLGSEGIDVLAFPIRNLVLTVVIAGLFGILAAILPARRGARINVIQAVSSE